MIAGKPISGFPLSSNPVAGISTDVTGVCASSQAQTTAGTGTVVDPAITGTAASSQAQTSAGTGTFTPAAVTGTATSSQAQTTAATGTTAAGVSGTASSSQAQTTAGTGVDADPITGVATSSQAQTTSGIGDIPPPPFVEPPNEVYIKRWYVRKNGRVYVFNSSEEADSYIAADKQADEAIAKAQATSKAAKKKIRRKIYDATGVEPESVSIDYVSGLVSLYGLQFDVPSLIAQSDFETFMQVALMAQAIEEEEIEMLLMA